MISHKNVIANVMQAELHDTPARRKMGIETQVMLGLLPLSHIYGLTLVALLSQHRGDEVIILPRFELDSFLAAVERFRIEQLAVVPPILIQMLANPEKCDRTDLSSVRFAFSGAAPLGGELVEDLKKKYPALHVGQGYGKRDDPPFLLPTPTVGGVWQLTRP